MCAYLGVWAGAPSDASSGVFAPSGVLSGVVAVYNVVLPRVAALAARFPDAAAAMGVHTHAFRVHALECVRLALTAGAVPAAAVDASVAHLLEREWCAGGADSSEGGVASITEDYLAVCGRLTSGVAHVRAHVDKHVRPAGGGDTARASESPKRAGVPGAAATPVEQVCGGCAPPAPPHTQCDLPGQVLELFPAMTPSHAERCVAYCDGDVERTIAMLLEGRMPGEEELGGGGAAGGAGGPGVAPLGLPEAREDPALRARIAALIRMRRCGPPPPPPPPPVTAVA